MKIRVIPPRYGFSELERLQIAAGLPEVTEHQREANRPAGLFDCDKSPHHFPVWDEFFET